MRFLKGFRCAWRGIVYCEKNERNMRIHTVVALYVFAFSFFFHLSRAEYAALFLTFAVVIMGELFNTVAEDICDRADEGFDPSVRVVKDMASGSVLAGAIFALCVAACLFWKPEGFVRMGAYFGAYPVMVAVLLLATAASLVFIILGPLGMRAVSKKRKQERKNRRE